MIRMQVGQKQMIDLTQRHLDLPKTLGRTAPGIKHQGSAVDLHKSGRAKAAHQRWRGAGAKQGDFKIAFLCSVSVGRFVF
jgi:hypothetical protein